MKVAILGAGAQGFVLMWHYGRRDDVGEVVLGDFDVSPDGNEIVFDRVEERSSVVLIERAKESDAH